MNRWAAGIGGFRQEGFLVSFVDGGTESPEKLSAGLSITGLFRPGADGLGRRGISGRSTFGQAALRPASELGPGLLPLPSAQLPQDCGSREKTKAAYRFFDHEKVTMDILLSAHTQKTEERMATHTVVLCVRNTSEHDYTPIPIRRIWGPSAFTGRETWDF